MFGKKLIVVWIAILALSSIYLMGQQYIQATAPAPLAKTGQTTSYATGDDGDLQKGVAWPGPRFTDNGDGTVTDNLTGLVWTRDADCSGTLITWNEGLDYCNTLAQGTCGLSDASIAGDWRLANRFELESLPDMKNHDLALPTGHPFTDVGHLYWSSTTYADGTVLAWYVSLWSGVVLNIEKDNNYSVWCVRDPVTTGW